MARTRPHPRDQIVEDDEMAPAEDIVVDLGRPEPAPRFRLVNNDVIEDDEPFAAEGPSGEHDENLAETLDDDYLKTLGMETVELVEQDIADRAPWRDRFERGMEMLGLVESDLDDGPFPGASNVVHPLILDAITQFWARACSEFLPPEGPVKIKTQGANKQNQEVQQRGERVAEFMNYDMVVGDAGYVSEKSKMFWMLPAHGSAAFKTFRAPVDGQVTGLYVPGEDLILQSSSSDLRSVPRFTHRMRKSMNEVKQLQIGGYYRDIDLGVPSMEDHDEVEAIKDEIDDTAPSGINDSDNRLTIYETLRELDVPGHEHTDEEGHPTGLGLPYYITVDRESEQVLSMRRAWRENDPTYRRRLYIRKYDFIPGPGSHGLGFFHFIGGLQTAASGALRVMLDSAASASLSGGFVSKQARLKGKRLISEPGVWQQVDASTDDLRQAFFPLPVKEPAPALFQMLEFITDLGRKFSSTTEMMTGDADAKNAPVGTTLALLEQGQKVMSTVHRLIHAEFARELKDRYDLHAEGIGHEGYPYEIDGEERAVYAEDFAPGVEITPVSDPNIFSNVQRLQIAQAVFGIAAEHSDVVDKKVATRRFFEAMKVPDIDELMPPDAEAQPYDAVGEIEAILLNKPVKVVPEQDHVSHLQSLWSFANNPQYGGNDIVMQQIGPALATVTAQHMAYAWATHARSLGAPAGYMDPESGQMQQPEVPPEQITAMAAQIAPQMAQVPGLPALDQGESKDGGVELEQAKIQGEQAKLQMKQEEHQMKMQQEAEKMAFEREKEQMKLQLEQEKAKAKMQIEQMNAQIKAQSLQQQAAMDQEMMQMDMQNQQQQMAQQSQMDQQRMAQESQMMQREGQMKEAQMGQQMQHAEQKSQMDMQRSQQQAMRPGKGDVDYG